MTKTKSTKRALLTSALSLLLCISMLVGTTFAWFTDSVTSGRNVIQSGNLDVELYYSVLNDQGVWTDYAKVEKGTDVFGYNLWEPGYTAVAKFMVKNEGSLALKYQLTTDVYSEVAGKTKTGEDIYLSKYLKYGVVTDLAKLNNRTDAAAAATTDFSSFELKAASLAANTAAEVGMVITMPTTVGNEANHNGTDIPKIEFGINLIATQDTVESDSFGNDYDADAPLPGAIIGSTFYATAQDAIDAAKDGDTIRLTAGTFHEALNLQGKSLTILGTGKDATIIAGPEDYTITNIPKQTWAGWGQDANVYALISANENVTIKNLTVKADPKEIGEVAEFRHQGDCAFVGIHVQSADATIENVDIKGIKPDTVTGNDHHNFGLYMTSAIGNDTTHTVTYKNGTVSDVNRGGIYCWGDKYTLNFENVTVIGPGNIDNPNGTLTPAAGSDKYIYAFAPFYVESSTTYNNVVVKDSYRVSWGGANWTWWGDNNWATNTPQGVTCINCGIAD